MTDRYRLSSPGSPSDQGKPPTRQNRHRDPLNSWLWIAIVVALVANVTMSVAGNDILSIPSGLVVIGCGIALFVRRGDRTP